MPDSTSDVEGVWDVRGGRPRPIPRTTSTFTARPGPSIGNLYGVSQDEWPDSEPRLAAAGGVDAPRESLDYNNPFRQKLERVWFDGNVVYACELGEIDVDPAQVKVAQEYQVVYAVELDESGKPIREPERVPGQYNIYDSVPGMEQYSPLWQFNFVIVPPGYVPNTLRSEAACLESGYPIVKSTVIEN